MSKLVFLLQFDYIFLISAPDRLWRKDSCCSLQACVYPWGAEVGNRSSINEHDFSVIKQSLKQSKLGFFFLLPSQGSSQSFSLAFVVAADAGRGGGGKGRLGRKAISGLEVNEEEIMGKAFVSRRLESLTTMESTS